MKNPLISIITINYNNKKGLEKTIKSVISQTYKNIEYIIIDGGSTDGSVDVIKKYQQYISKWLSEPDKGLYDAINKGIKLATGEIIGLLHADDEYCNKFIVEKIVDTFKNNPVISYFCAKNIFIDKNNQISHLMGEKPDLYNFLKKLNISHTTLYVKRKVIDKIGYYSNEYKIAGDFDWILRLLLSDHGNKFYFYNKPINKMPFGISDKRCFLGKYEELKIKNKHFPDKKLVNYFYYFYYIIRILTRKLLTKLKLNKIIFWIRKFEKKI